MSTVQVAVLKFKPLHKVISSIVTVSNPIIGKLLTSPQLYLIITDINRFEPRKFKEFALFQNFVVTSIASDNLKASSVVVTLLLSQKIGEPGMRNLK